MSFSAKAIIQCPFFKEEKKNLLCCEGFIEGTCMTTAFRTRENAVQYILDNCVRVDGGSCPMASNLFEKYRKIREAEEQAEKEWREKLIKARGIFHSGDNFIEGRTAVN